MATITNVSQFKPTQISGCALWLDAADNTTIILSGSNVTQWNDKSGNGYNAIPSSSPSPTYVTSNINITNSSYFSGALNIAAGTLLTTAFCVAITPSSFPPSERLLSANDGTSNGADYSSPTGFQYAGAATSGTFAAYRSTGTNTLSGINSNTRMMTTTLYNTNGTFFLSLNGNYPNGYSNYYTSNSNAATTNALIKYWIGEFSGGGQNWNGYVNEFIIFNRTLLQSEYQQVEGYLSWKWGLQATLPTSHPYYSNPIVPNLPFQNNVFSPKQISGCSLWLDAADNTTISLTGSNVTQWNDKSGNGYNAIPSSSPSPSYSTSNINITNSSYFSGALNIAAGTLLTTAFCVAITPAAISVSVLLSANNGTGNDYASPTGFQYSAINGTGFYSYRNGLAQTSGSITTNTRIMNTILYNSNGAFINSVNGNFPNGNSTFYGNGSNTAITSNLTNYWLGASYQTSSITQYWQGYINEIIIFNRTLLQSEYQQVEGYLAWKWNLQSSLPTTHPYYYKPIIQNQLLNPTLNKITSLFYPTQISGCSLWLDAADPTTVILSGSNVTQWNDKSGNGYNSTSVTGTPKYSNNLITFPGTTYITTPSISFSATNMTFFIVLQFTNTFIYPSDSNNEYCDFFNSTGTQYMAYSMVRQNGSPYNWILDYYSINGIANVQSSTFYSNASGPTGIFYIFTIVTNSPQYSLYLNGINVNTVNGTTFTPTTPTTFTIGKAGNGLNIGEIIFYGNTTLTTAQQQQVEGYLAWKWNLQANLPTSHPYYYNPIVQNLVLQNQLLNSITNTGFKPTILSNLSLWLDAADLTTLTLSGSNVVQWNDKSGMGNNATPLASGSNDILGSPTYSSSPKGITFTSASSSYGQGLACALSSSSAVASGFVVFVDSNLSPSYASTIIGGSPAGSSATGGRQWRITGNGHSMNNGGITGGQTATLTAFNSSNIGLINFVDTGASPLAFFEFGTTLTTTGTYNGSYTASRITIIGCRGGGGGYGEFLNGTIMELIVYSTALSTTQRQQVEGYLAWKWGLQTNLPASYPYYLFPPN